jgi:hypothetical protein
MGTTLAFTGAYNLAGSLLSFVHASQAPNSTAADPTSAFQTYSDNMRPIVTKAQKLFPGAPHSLAPETNWGILVFLWIGWLVTITNIGGLIFRLKGPPAFVGVEDFGFHFPGELIDQEVKPEAR